MKTYTGSCHCKAVTYEVSTDLANVISCNCSRCHMLGALLTFVPASDFRLLSGEENLQEYRFNKQVIEHLFCKTCGIQSFSRGSRPDGIKMVAINLRCVEGVDPGELSATPFDGKNKN